MAEEVVGDDGGAGERLVDLHGRAIRVGEDVEALERCGVATSSPTPASCPWRSTRRSPVIANHLFHHEHGEAFAASGFARSSSRVGVCVATSGPGATNLVSALAEVLLDSVPMVAITGQVPRRVIGTDAFQETPIVEGLASVDGLGGPVDGLSGLVVRLFSFFFYFFI